MRAAHDAHVMPVTSRSMTSTAGSVIRSGDVVAGFIDGRHDVVAVQLLAANGDEFGLEVDADVGDAANCSDLASDGLLAVTAAHAGHREHHFLHFGTHDR